MRRPLTLGWRLKRNLDEAARSRGHALTACIGLSKVPHISAGDRNAVIFTAELPLFVSVIFLAKLLVPTG